ncbi:MAG TPA: hypothetical protein VMH87_14520 [Pseudomonadales bacterium]|nr:hypothetical protein [Pseudomonadales bacterium]
MSRNEPFNENGPLFLIAGLACLVCLPIIYLATRLVIWWLHVSGVEWLLLALFIILPLSVTFIILYSSAWHREWPKMKRVLSAALSSCFIFGIDLFIIILLIVMGGLVAGLGRAMGGN